MSIFKNYQTASFRNITFILEDESTNDGRKTVSHEFVNSNKRFVEDLGHIPIVFNISGFVHGDGGSGFSERDALKEALNKKGIGQLVHPVYGSVDVVADPYTVSSSMRNAGRFSFRMVFRTQSSDREPFIQPSRGVFGDTINPDNQNALVTPATVLTQNPNFATSSQLADIAEEARDSAESSAEDIFEVATDQNFFDDIKEIYLEGIDKIRDVTSTIEDDTLRALGLTGVDRLFNDPPGFLSNPSILFSDLIGLYNDIAGAGNLDKWVEAAEDFSEIFSLGNTTQRDSAVSSAYGSLVSSFQINALINAYQSGVVTSFDTVDELEDAEEKLDTLFQSLVNDPIDDSIIDNINFPELRTLLLEMRSTTKIIFSQKEQNTFKIVDFDSNGRSILQTTYDLYESLDNLTIVANLNKNINATSPDSALKVLEEV